MPIEFKDDTFICEGNFCSIPCMKTYNLELNDSYKNRRFMLINSLSLKTHGTIENSFAPRKECLDCFGGNLSICDFRKLSSDTPSIKTVYPMKIIKSAIESDFTLIRGKTISETNNVVNDPIKLERNKPLRNNQNTLETTMGLFKN